MNFFAFEQGQRDIKKRNTIVVPLDTFLLLGIVVVLLFILSFSLGVERGRKIAERYLAEKNKGSLEAIDDKFSIPPADLEKEENDNQNQPKEEAAVKDSKEQAEEKKGDKKDKEEDKEESKYIIQLVTYLKEKIAIEEVEKLKKEGYPVYVSKKGNFTVILLGGFKNQEEAQKNMQILRKKYKDCFIRRFK